MNFLKKPIFGLSAGLLAIVLSPLLTSCSNSSSVSESSVDPIQEACDMLETEHTDGLKTADGRDYVISAGMFRKLSANNPDFSRYAEGLGNWSHNPSAFYDVFDFCGIEFP